MKLSSAEVKTFSRALGKVSGDRTFGASCLVLQEIIKTGEVKPEQFDTICFAMGGAAGAGQDEAFFTASMSLLSRLSDAFGRPLR